MNRRQFMGFSAASFFLTACGGSESSSQSTPPLQTKPPAVPPVESMLSTEQWQALENNLTGRLILPTNTEHYSNARVVFNVRYDHIYPQAIVHCATEQDVMTALAFVKEHNMHVTSRSGSHGYTGNSTSEGLVIDVTPLNTITLNDGTARIGAGARLTDIYDQLTAQGVAVPLGSCLSVGIAGLVQGGGFGVVGRAYGLTSDNLLSAEIVTAQGEIITCDKTNHAELFWALQGGGGGNFGVATAFTFKTHPTSDITVFEANFAFDDFEEVMANWQTLAQTWPDEMWGQCLPDWTSTIARVNVRAFCLNTQEVASVYWQDFLNRTNAIPTSSHVNTNSYRDVMLGNCSTSITSCHIATQFSGGRMPRGAFAASSDFFEKPIPPAGTAALKAFIEQSISSGNRGMIILNLMGGQIANIEATDSAFNHRNAQVSAEYYTALSPSASNDRIDSTQQWQNSFRQLMSPWSTGGAYVNYLDPLISNWQHAYYGDNYLKLQQVKQHYDPQWLFKLPQGIVPA